MSVSLLAKLLFATVLPVLLLQASGSNSDQTSSIDAGAAEHQWNYVLLSSYCLLIVGASVFGGWLSRWLELTHTRMQTIISFVGGLMLGIGILHMLPHAAHDLASLKSASFWMLTGIVVMFLLIRTFHFHHHGPLEISTVVEDTPLPMLHDHDHDHDHGNCTIDHSRPLCHHAHELSWLGIAVGLSLHTLIDGIALAASVQAESLHPGRSSLFGIGTFLAIMLHKPLDAVSITSLMAAGGWSRASRNWVNGGFALMCPLGAALFLLGARSLPGLQPVVVAAALAFSAGVFICISLSDLLPEMEFHSHNRTRLTIALLAGISLAWFITWIEPSHYH
ncbi:MAG: ZIP family metal transporter [Planctomyces sp.]|nr:ZIP family metal transporter [Planctomyces sp.]